jgi:hypothetical protein
MDNLGVRLPVDAPAKSKCKSDRPHESYERKNDCWFQKTGKRCLALRKYRTARLDGRAILPVCARIQEI